MWLQGVTGGYSGLQVVTKGYRVHNWSQATDATGAAVRVVLFDYRKAFDLIDHNLFARKIEALDMPRWVRVWVLDFLSDRKQRVKLSSDCRSEWGLVPAGVPQGTKLCPWLFLLMINDLEVDALTWKYVDDTTIAQTIPRGLTSDVQSAVSAVEAHIQIVLRTLLFQVCVQNFLDQFVPSYI